MVQAASPGHDAPQQRLLEAFFLPDLCNTRAILFLLAVSEGLVLILTLMETSLQQFSLQRFGLVSLFVQWVALVSVALLCQLRHRLMRLSVMSASLFAMVLVQLVTLMVGLLADHLWPSDLIGTDWHWLLRNALVSGLVTALAMRYFYVQSQWRIQAQAELQSRLAALQANIRPHFFFNTLNTVAALIMTDPDKAETMLLDLAQLFRVVLKADDQPMSLAMELELGQRYLDIERTRLGERLQVDWEIASPLPEAWLPALMLQPLLENAVYHGVQPRPDGGWIRIRVGQLDGRIHIEVSNARPARATSHGNGIAQQNIRARLNAMFGDQADMEINASDEEYRVQLILPGQDQE